MNGNQLHAPPAAPLPEPTSPSAATLTTSAAGSLAHSSNQGSAVDLERGNGFKQRSTKRAGAALELPTWRFWAVMISLMISVFLFALDQLIVATAIPKITEKFHSLTQLPWLASGFFLPLFALVLIYAQCLEIFPSKHVIMFAVFVFEMGSLVCGVAPDMNVLIFGRALAGAGAAGIFSTGLVIIAEITPLHNRAQYFALIGVCFGLSSVLGPLVGGALSDHVSWRWCFYINLPIGGVALVTLFFFQPDTPPLGRRDTYKGYSWQMLHEFLLCDWVGAGISMGWAVCLILSLQYGGVTKKWSDGGVIAMLVLSGVLPFVFVAWEMWLGPKRQMLKLHLLKRRSISGASILMFFLFAAFMLLVYYMSLDLQAVYHFSATDAGVRLLPMILVQIVVMIASARVIPLIGRFKWVIVAGPMFIGLGSGLLYSIKSGTPISHLYGFQVLIGIGIGLALQNSMLAIQYELKAEPKLISAGTGAGTFLGFMGRIIGISLGGSVFENMIQVNLHKYAPTLPPSLVHAVVSNAAAIWTQVPESFRPDVLYAYTETIRVVYLIGLPMAILGMLGGLMIKNGKMPRKDDAPIGPGVTAAVAAGVETKSENGGRVEDAELAPKETEREQRERQ